MKHPKRILALLLCALLLTGMLSPCAAAAAPPLSITSEGGKRGDTAVVEIRLDDLSLGVAGGHFKLSYDAANLTVISAVAGEAAAGCLTTSNLHYTDSSIRFTFSSMDALTTGGVLLRVTFRIGKDAPLGALALNLTDVKLFDCNAATVSRVGASGTLDVHSVSLRVGSQSCLPGQSVSLPLRIDGKLAPSGGEFEVHFDERLLTAGAVKAAQKLSGNAINLSYQDPGGGCVKVSWASAGQVSGDEELCSIVFAVNELASGDAHVSLENVRFFDENGTKMDCSAAEPGVISVIRDYNAQPTLYMVGGKLDGKTATVQVAVDGAGLVCGGTVRIGFDPQKVKLMDLTKKMPYAVTNPDTVDGVTDCILVSWAQDVPALDKQPILELQFELLSDDIAELIYSDVTLLDQNGLAMSDIRVHSGEIGVAAQLQTPVTDLSVLESGMHLHATLYDAAFCDDQKKTQDVRYILAYYQDGKTVTTQIPSDSVVFDAFGVAVLSADIGSDIGNEVQLFFLNADGSMRPMCSAVKVQLAD